MIITVNGKITAALSPRRGTAKTGNEWVSQDFVIETENGIAFASICLAKIKS